MFTRKTLFLAVAMSTIPCMAFAQSSGNFSYGNTGTTHCMLNNNGTGSITDNNNGEGLCTQQTGDTCTTNLDCGSGLTCWNLTGGTGAGQCLNSTNGMVCTSSDQCTVPGQTCVKPAGENTGVCGKVQNKACGGTLKAGIKTNSGAGNVFVIRPSAVIGLLTDVSVGKNSTINVGTSSALAGVDFTVKVKSLSGQPDVNVIPSYAITYASRFVQISTNLFNVLGDLCTVVTPTGETNTVGGITTAAGCYISFNESTVSAHSFDWIAGAPKANGSGVLASGNYGIQVDWNSSLGNFGISRSLTCVGPVNLTVQQNKVFSFNTPNTF